jgi:hypothetical protein
MALEQTLIALNALMERIESTEPNNRRLRSSAFTLKKLLPKACKASACLAHYYILKEASNGRWEDVLELVSHHLENSIHLVSLSLKADFRKCYEILPLEESTSYKSYCDLLMDRIAPIADEESGKPSDLSFCFTFEGKICCTEEALVKRLKMEQEMEVA